MSRAEYFVMPNGSEWKIVHNRKDFVGYKTQSAAIEAAREAAIKSHQSGYDAQVHVARPSGEWRTEWTYGNDPRRYTS